MVKRMRKRTFRTMGLKHQNKLNLRQKLEVKRLISGEEELKYFLQSTNNQTVTNAGVIFKQSGVPQGDTDSTRDGDRLKISHAVIRGMITNNQCADPICYFRFFVVQWKPNDTVSPLLTDLFNNGYSGAVDYLSDWNHDKRQLFKVIYDKLWVLNGNCFYSTNTVSAGGNLITPTTSNTSKCFHVNLFGKKFIKSLQYQAGGLAGTNQIYWGAITNNSSATHPSINMSFKLFYHDV